MVAFVSKEDAHRKLQDVVVMYDKRPCFVKVRIEDGLNVVRLTSTHSFTEKLPTINNLAVDVSTDPKFSLRLPSLGYVNSDRRVFSFRRSPVRRNKASLHSENVYIETAQGDPANGAISYASRQVASMLLNIYPSFKDALQNVMNGGYSSEAFTKTMFVGKIGKYEIGIYSLGRLIAVYNDSTDAFRVVSSRDYSFVLDLLKKHGVPTC